MALFFHIITKRRMKLQKITCVIVLFCFYFILFFLVKRKYKKKKKNYLTLEVRSVPDILLTYMPTLSILTKYKILGLGGLSKTAKTSAMVPPHLASASAIACLLYTHEPLGPEGTLLTSTYNHIREGQTVY